MSVLAASCSTSDSEAKKAEEMRNSYKSAEIRMHDSTSIELLSKINTELIGVLTIIHNKTSNMDTKRVSGDLLKNHTEFQANLLAKARDKGITLVENPSTEVRDRIRQLDTMHYEAFNQESLLELKNRYAYIIESTTDVQNQVENEDLKNFIATELAFMESSKEYIAGLK